MTDGTDKPNPRGTLKQVIKDNLLKNHIEIAGILKFESSGAILFDAGNGSPAWIGKHLISDLDHERQKGKPLTILIPEWLAKKQGFIN